MGDLRYYYIPLNLLKPEELPEGWGLLEWDGHFTRKRKEAVYKEADKKAEVAFLTSVIRRLQLSTCVYVAAESV